MKTTIHSAAGKRLALVAFTSLCLSACGGGGGGAPGGGGGAGGTAGGETVAAGPSPLPIATGPATTTTPTTAPTTPTSSAPGAVAQSPGAAAPGTTAQLVGPGSGSNIAVLANGQQVLAWKDASNLCWRRYTNQSTPLADAQCRPVTRSFPPATVAALGTGFVLAWLEADTDAYNSTYSLKTQAFTQAGAPSGPTWSTPASDAVFGFSSATLASGDVVLAYEGGSHVHLLRVDAAGTVTEPIPQVDSSVDVTIPAGGRTAALADGGFVVTWDELDLVRGRVIHMRLFDAAFRARSAETIVPGNGQAFGALPSALPDGGFVMMWDGAEAGVQRFTAQGVAVGPRTLLDPAWMQTPPDTCYTPTPTRCGPRQASVSLTTTSDGGWVALWNNLDGHASSRGTFAMRFAADGAAVSAPVRMDMALNAARSYPVTIAARAADSGFTLTWNTSVIDLTTGLAASSTWLQRFTGDSLH